MTDLERAKSLLVPPATCVLAKGEDLIVREERGVAPLVALYREGIPEGYSAADRVVGRAAAFLYVLLGVKAVYAAIISAPAMGVLRGHGIAVEAETVVDRIVNRAGDGLCPMESAVMDTEDPRAAYAAVTEKLAAMQGGRPADLRPAGADVSRAEGTEKADGITKENFGKNQKDGQK